MAAAAWSEGQGGRPDRRSALLSLALHGGALAAALALARPETAESLPPPAMVVQIVAEAVGAGPADGASGGPPPAPPEARAAAAEAAPPVRTEPKIFEKPRHRPRPAPAATSPAAATAAPAAASPASPPRAAGDDHHALAGDGREPAATGAGPAAGAAGPAGTAGSAGMDAYLAELRRSIQRHLVYPPAARRLGLSGLVLVRFRLAADGRVDMASLAVTGGSDDDILRRGAVDTIRRLPPPPPPPQGAMGIEVPVNFTLTVNR